MPENKEWYEEEVNALLVCCELNGQHVPTIFREYLSHLAAYFSEVSTLKERERIKVVLENLEPNTEDAASNHEIYWRSFGYNTAILDAIKSIDE